jgi:hypothetical protein
VGQQSLPTPVTCVKDNQSCNLPFPHTSCTKDEGGWLRCLGEGIVGPKAKNPPQNISDMHISTHTANWPNLSLGIFQIAPTCRDIAKLLTLTHQTRDCICSPSPGPLRQQAQPVSTPINHGGNGPRQSSFIFGPFLTQITSPLESWLLAQLSPGFWPFQLIVSLWLPQYKSLFSQAGFD